MTLTDADRAAILEAGLNTRNYMLPSDTTTERERAIYLAGIRAGLERGAQVCEARGAKLPLSFKATCMACAAAILALASA